MEYASHKPTHFKRYVDDTIIIPMDVTSLMGFQSSRMVYIRTSHSLWKLKHKGSFLFQMSWYAGSQVDQLEYFIYRKFTHTHVYLNAYSCHRPEQKKSF